MRAPGATGALANATSTRCASTSSACLSSMPSRLVGPHSSTRARRHPDIPPGGWDQGSTGRRQGRDGATTDLRQIRSWWRDHQDDNIGLACGVLFDVLDVDVKDDRPGMESLDKLRHAGLLRGVWGKAHTPTGGLHLLFAPSGAGNSNHGAGKLGLDYRGRGGYIVAAPSVTEAGAYQWAAVEPDRRGLVFDWEAARRVLGLVRTAPAAQVSAAPLAVSGGNPAYVSAAVARELDELRATRWGGRNDALNDAAFNLGQLVGGGELDEAEVERLLIETARSLDTEPRDPFTDREIFGTVRSALGAGKQQPRQAPPPKLRLVPPPVTVVGRSA